MDFTKDNLAKSKHQITTVVFLSQVTFYIYSKYTIADIYPLFDTFYLGISAVLKLETLLPHINFPKTTLVRCPL